MKSPKEQANTSTGTDASLIVCDKETKSLTLQRPCTVVCTCVCKSVVCVCVCVCVCVYERENV